MNVEILPSLPAEGELAHRLFLSIIKNDPKEARLLIEQGAPLDQGNRQQGDTPLHMASRYGFDHLVGIFLEAGADIHARNLHGETPLHCAALCSSISAMGALLDGGASIHAEDKNGDWPIHSQWMWENLEIVKKIVALGADVNLVTDLGTRPLYEAILNENRNLIDFLAASGAEINQDEKDNLAEQRALPELIDRAEAGMTSYRLLQIGSSEKKDAPDDLPDDLPDDMEAPDIEFSTGSVARARL